MSKLINRNEDRKRRLNDQERLESWKAIANYLHRSVRTVRRWEGDEELPIYRHKHSSGYSVYAYCAELDVWRNSQRQSKQPKSGPEARAWSSFPVLAGYSVVAFVAAIVGAMVGAYSFEIDPLVGTTTVTSDTWVLIAAAENQDGYPDIGTSLTAALRREISGSYRALPQRRIQFALSLMRQDQETTLSLEVAREVALRDGKVSAVLVPRLEQLGDTYVVSVEVIDPHNDQLIAYCSEKIDNLRAILPAVERLADGIRAGLSVLPESQRASNLPHVTTSSMSALRLYSRAHRYLIVDQPMVAEELLNLAVHTDPNFASARILQAWALKRQGASKATYVHISSEANDLIDQVTPPERYFIEGSYRYFSGDLIRADASYRALLEIKPDHLLGAHALLGLCLVAEPPGACVDQKVRLAKIRTDDFELNLQAAWSLAADAGSVELANYYADRSLEIWRNGDKDFPPRSVARALIFPVFSAWSAGDIEGALWKSQQLVEVLPTLPIDARNILIEHLVEFSTMLGRTDEASVLLEKLSDPAKRHELRAGFLFASGDKGKLKSHFESGTEFNNGQVSALLMAISGLPDEAMELHNVLRARGMSNTKGAVIRARVAFGNGGLAAARSELEAAVADLTLDDQAFFFVGHDLLAAVLKSDDQLADAIRVLERTTLKRGDAAFNNAGLYWLMCQRQLAGLYREAGREADASLIEKKLRKLLILADNDFPLRSGLGDV